MFTWSLPAATSAATKTGPLCVTPATPAGPCAGGRGQNNTQVAAAPQSPQGGGGENGWCLEWRGGVANHLGAQEGTWAFPAAHEPCSRTLQEDPSVNRTVAKQRPHRQGGPEAWSGTPLAAAHPLTGKFCPAGASCGHSQPTGSQVRPQVLSPWLRRAGPPGWQVFAEEH